MEIRNKIVAVTGAASGIGKALAEAFSNAGANFVACADINFDDAQSVATSLTGEAYKVDVSKEEDIKSFIDSVESQHGPIDLFCSNAGIGFGGGVEVNNDKWQRIWDVNLMAHVWAARYLVPLMIERGGGYLLNTASAAGLLSQIGSAPYAVTKHAAVGLAEWLAITYGDQGIKVSVLCPQAVRTKMTAGNEGGVASVDGMMEPETVAQVCLEAIEAEQFLITPHAEVRDYIQKKTQNYERWIGGMRKLNRQYTS